MSTWSIRRIRLPGTLCPLAKGGLEWVNYRFVAILNCVCISNPFYTDYWRKHPLTLARLVDTKPEQEQEQERMELKFLALFAEMADQRRHLIKSTPEA
ncbi:MAG: hypothetical protein DMG05_03300 [Acidobacteria bacterium]|nr:MAG: hypothetical protein DMG05_03300 [Acidobacteriota bacterium]